MRSNLRYGHTFIITAHAREAELENVFLLAAKNNYYDNNNDYVRIKICDTSEYNYFNKLLGNYFPCPVH